jgi:hypothetical protein
MGTRGGYLYEEERYHGRALPLPYADRATPVRSYGRGSPNIPYDTVLMHGRHGTWQSYSRTRYGCTKEIYYVQEHAEV